MTVPPVCLSVFPQPPPSSLSFWTITSCLHQVVLAEHQRLHEPFHFRWIENHFKWWKDTLAYPFFLTFVTFFCSPKKKSMNCITHLLLCSFVRHEMNVNGIKGGLQKKKRRGEKKVGASQDFLSSSFNRWSTKESKLTTWLVAFGINARYHWLKFQFFFFF